MPEPSTETENELTLDQLLDKVPTASDEALDELVEQENKREKPRKGLFDAVEKEQAKRKVQREEEKASEPTFSHEQLLANSNLAVGVSRHLLAGALKGAKNPLTKAEAKDLAKKFARKEVVTSG
jgi:hypothetical protein